MAHVLPIRVGLNLIRPGTTGPVLAPGTTWYEVHAYLDGAAVVPPGQTALVWTGFSLDLPVGYEAQVRPRASIAMRRGLVAVSGTISAGYDGEVGVVLLNAGRDAAIVRHGEVVAVLVFAPVVLASFDNKSLTTGQGRDSLSGGGDE